MRHKYTILSALLLVIPSFVYALWMGYGWMFSNVQYTQGEFERTMTAIFVVVIGSFVTAFVHLVER